MSDSYTEEYCRTTWGPLVRKLNQEVSANRNLIKHLEAEITRLQKDAEAGRAFKKMMKAVRENPLLKDPWDKFMFALKMVD